MAQPDTHAKEPVARDLIGRHPARSYVLWRAQRFLNDTPTVRRAASVIVAANIAIALMGAVAMRVFDATDFPHIGLSLWWAVQTATTVGYGDVTPQTVGGRLIAAVVMLQGIAFIAVVTASITSTFVARAQRHYAGVDPHWELLASRLDELDQRLAGLTAAVGEGRGGSPPSNDVAAGDDELNRAHDPVQED